MSTPIYHLPTSTYVEPQTSWIWVIIVIILIIVIIALVIWLIVRHTQNDNGSFNRLVTLQGGAIRSSAGSITGKWGILSSETDTVTLYVSTKPIVFGANGLVICNQGTCQHASGTGSTNSVTITNLTVNTTYNAVLVATNKDTTSYAIYGPQKVFTQETAQLANTLFNIKDLNNPSGSVSTTGTYTESSTNIGIYRYGPSPSTANSSSRSFLVKYDNNTDVSNPALILCRSFASANPLSTNVVLADWSNFDDITVAPLIYPQGADQVAANLIPVSNCEWSYNDEPPEDAEGRNAWCLLAQQQTMLNNSTFKETLCLARNGNALSLVTPSQATTWYNQFFAASPVTN